ncbi:MAG: dihydrodipicolinate synthase family protein [Clostridia bacterium]|nr:dihydrodipicolinate synthase family protein [Clostridia bacterium]
MDIFTTMITPYHKDGTIDFEKAEKYVDWYFEKGLTGIFSVCQSSEIFWISTKEKAELNKRVYERVKYLEKNTTKNSRLCRRDTQVTCPKIKQKN